MSDRHPLSLPQRITKEDNIDQRENGWVDWHPEDFCERCGNRNISSWCIESDRFNAAMEALGLTSGAIVCPSCFVIGHELASGMKTTWRLFPDLMTPFRHADWKYDGSVTGTQEGEQR